MSENTLDTIAKRVQIVEKEIADLRTQYTGDKRVVEERLDRVEKAMAADGTGQDATHP